MMVYGHQSSASEGAYFMQNYQRRYQTDTESAPQMAPAPPPPLMHHHHHHNMQNQLAAASLAESRTDADELRAERRRLLSAVAASAEAAEVALQAERTRSARSRRRLAEKLGSRLEAEQLGRREAEERLAVAQLEGERALLEVEAGHQRRMQGLLPAEAQRQLEATIGSLHEQVASLRLRCQQQINSGDGSDGGGSVGALVT